MREQRVEQTNGFRTCSGLYGAAALLLVIILTGQAGAYTAEYYVNSTGYWEEGSPFISSVYPINAACNAAVDGARVRVVETGVYNDTISISAASPAGLTLDLGGATLQHTTALAISISSGVDGFTARNGTINGYQNSISITGTVSRCVFDDLTIIEPTYSGIILGGAGSLLTDIAISDCLITEPGNYGIDNSQSQLERVTLQNITITGPGYSGIELIDDAYHGKSITDLVIVNTTVTGAEDRGIVVTETMETSNAPILENITVTGSSNSGIQLTILHGVTLSNINATACGQGTGDYGLTITGPTGGVPVQTERITVQNCSAGVNLQNVHDVAFGADDVIHGNGAIQVSLSNVQNITVEDQAFSDAERAYTRAISLGGTSGDVTIRNITATGAGEVAIFCGTEGSILTSVTIADSLIQAPGQIAIRNYRSTHDGLAIQNVTIEEPGTNGIEITDYAYSARPVTDLVIENATVTGAGDRGIVVTETTGTSNAPVLENITVTGSTNTGIQLTILHGVTLSSINATACGGDAADYGLTITGPTGGVPVQTERIAIQNCSAGVNLQNVHDVAFGADDVIHGNGAIQVYLSNVQNITVEDQAFSDAERAYTRAVSLGGTSGDVIIRNITATGAGQDAIYCGTDGSTLTNVTIAGSLIRAPGQTAIRNYRATHEGLAIQDVIIQEPGTNGVDISDYDYYNRYITGLQMDNITVSGAGNLGISIGLADENSGGVRADDITITESINTGLFIVSMGQSSLTNITVAECGGDTGDWGVSYQSPGTELTTGRMTLLNNSNGIYLKGARNTVLGGDVITMSGNGNTQISLQNGENITVQDFRFDSALTPYSYAVSLYGTSDKIHLSNITAVTPTYDLLYISGPTSNLTARDLTADRPQRHGIYAYEDLIDSDLRNITITDPNNAGFSNYYRYGNMENVTISNWTISTPGTEGGITISDSSPASYNTPIKDITIEQVNITGSAGQGVVVSQSSNANGGNITIDGCRVENCTGTGIQITWRGTAVFEDLISTGNSGYGLALTAVPDSAEAPSLGAWTVYENSGGVQLTGFSDTIFSPAAGQSIHDNRLRQINLVNGENITVRDYAFTADVQPYEFAVVVSGTSAGISITNITAISPTYELLYYDGTTTNTTATDLTITTPGRNGIYAYGAITNARFANVTVTHPGSSGFVNYYKYGNMENVTFSNWTISSPGTTGGIAISDSSPTSYNTPIKDITLEQVNVYAGTGAGVSVSQSSNANGNNITIAGCRVENCAGIGIQFTWRGTAVFDDIISTGNGGYGVSLKAVADSAEAPSLGTWSVSGNTGGIAMTGLHDTTFSGTRQILQDNGVTGLALQNARNVTLRDYVFTAGVQPYNYAVTIDGVSDGVHLTNITADSPTYELLYYGGTTENTTATDLTITTPGRNGIYAYGAITNARFANVTVTNPASSGFANYYRYGNMENVTISNWTVSTPGTEGGITISDSSPSSYNTPIKDITIEQVNITGSAGPGIVLRQNSNQASGGITFSGVEVADDPGNGLEIHYRGEAVITDARITGCGDAGAEAGLYARGYGTHTLNVSGGAFSGNNYGIYLINTTGALIHDAIIPESILGGVYVSADCTGMTMHNVSFNTTVPAGFDLVPAGGIVLGDAWSAQSTPYPATGIFAGVQPLSAASAVNITIPISGSPDPADLKLFISHEGDDWAILPDPNNATVTGPASADVFAAVAPASLPAAATWYTITPLVYATGDINVTSVPDSGWVWLDGTNMSVQTDTLLTDVPVGTHTVMVTREGFLNATNSSVVVVSDATTAVSFTLEKHWEIPLTAGWNMVSVPTEGTTISWPAEVTTSCYRYDGSVYVSTSRDTLQPGTGYWISCTAPCTLVIEDVPVSSYTLAATAGWNMIGATGETRPTGDLTTTPPGLVTGTVYSYNGATYVAASDLEPGIGYWAGLTGSGTIALG